MRRHPHFGLRMAWRETRASWRHFLAFLVCIALGVAALVSVGSLAAGLDRTLQREAKTLMGGDLELRSTRPLDPAAEARLAELETRGAAVTHVRELVAMAREPGRGASLLVELKAVEDLYPLYGRIEASPARPLPQLLGPEGALVEESLLQRLGLRPGDRLVIGTAELTVTGILRKEPDRSASLFTLGPRVLVAAAALERTGLLQLGSRVRYRALARLPDTLDAHAIRDDLVRALAEPALRISTSDEAQPALRRFFEQLTTYLGLVGLVSLLVGGIGVAASVRSFVKRKLATIAILKSLGARSRLLVTTYLVQALALGGLGSAIGAILGATAQALLTPLLAGLVPFEVEARLSPGTMLHGIAMGLLTTLLCATWPLLEVRTVPPALILRQPIEGSGRRARRPWLAVLPIAAGLAGLALWQAGSLKVGGIFVGASGAALALLAGAGRLLAWLARRIPRLPWLAWRLGLAGLSRPGDQTAGVVVALGVGVMLIVTVALLEGSLARELDLESRREAPSFFFVDIQPDQVDAFTRVVGELAGGTPPALTPVVRSRLAAINGHPITRERRERDREAWRYTRDYVLTYAAAPPAANVVTRGRWWTEAEAATRPRISVEEEAAKSFGVDVGGTLTFDIQGVLVEAEVMSLRHVDWQSLSTNFFVIFSPGALDGAPQTYVAAARVTRDRELALQDGVAALLPNVTAIPVRDILDRISRVMTQIGVAIRLIALFVIGAGIVVMAGALMATRYQRLYESVLLRTLGASRGAVARAFAVEYACVGATAGLAGTALAVLLAGIVLRLILDVPWTVTPAALALGVAGSIGLALAVGFLGTFRLLGQKPLPVLRRD